MGPETELFVKTFGAYGISLGLCVLGIIWLSSKLKACDARNVFLVDKIIELSKTQSADIERNTASLMMLREILTKDRQNPLVSWPDQKRSGG